MVSFFWIKEIAYSKQKILAIEYNIIKKVTKPSRFWFKIKIAENVDERADKIVDFFKNFLTGIVIVVVWSNVEIGLQLKDPKVHDKPVSEYYYKEPWAECAGE